MPDITTKIGDGELKLMAENGMDGIATILREREVSHSMLTEVICVMADELLRLRQASRRDSHRAGQLRRLKWLAETLVRKVEELAAQFAAEDAAAAAQSSPPTSSA